MKKIFTLIAALAVTLTSSAQIASQYSLVTDPTAGFGGAPASVVQGSLGLTSFGMGHANTGNIWMAEKITVPASGWIIDSLITYGYQTGSTTVSTMTGHYCFISPDSAGMPDYTPTIGSRTTNAMVYSAFTGIYRVSETTLTNTTRPIMKLKSNLSGTLPTGTYWIVWSAAGSLASGPWTPPVTKVGIAVTGAAMQYITPTWTASVDAGNAQGQNYKLFGKINTGVTAPETGLNSVSVYPNPVANAATVKIEFANNSDLTASDISFEVMDQLGRVVISQTNIASTTFSIERGELAAGTYTYKVINKTNGTTLKTDKLIIQ